MAARCRHCGAQSDRPDDQRTWETVCPTCGRLLWLGVGDVLACPVTAIHPFGVTVDIGDGVDGLIHVTELADRFVWDPEEIVRLGGTIRARVIVIDCVRRRISPTCRGGA
jgi:ribosomal protein S1